MPRPEDEAEAQRGQTGLAHRGGVDGGSQVPPSGPCLHPPDNPVEAPCWPGRCHPGTAGLPDSPRPRLLTQHVDSVEPGVLAGRVVGHAGVGARVRGPQALQHQGAVVQVDPVEGRESREAGV